MPKKGHTEGQIVAVLRQAEAGERVPTFAARWGSTGGLLPVEGAYPAKLESTTAMASVTAAIQRIPTLSLLVWGALVSIDRPVDLWAAGRPHHTGEM